LGVDGTIGLLVEPMAAPGFELIVGVRRDPSFGPVVLVGLGGILTEVLDDVSIRLAPVGQDEAVEMLTELRGYGLLSGVRGRSGASLDSVADIVVRLGEIALADPDILEIDLNPVIATPDDATVVDALIVTAAP
jgi:acyl-CoA synthetase (NDP forming)